MSVTSHTSERNIIVKWNGQEYDLGHVMLSDTVGTLKTIIYDETGVRPERQKLLNVKYPTDVDNDDCELSEVQLPANFKIMMVGSREEDIAQATIPPEDLPDIIDDLEVTRTQIPIRNQDVYLTKIEKRVQTYNIQILNEFREGKHLLVLDVDYTLYDHRSTGQNAQELMRPYLHQFLTSAYEDYDIVIWSATSMKWIDEKMKVLGVSSNPHYKIAFYLDELAMISVYIPNYRVIQVKPLGVIWGKFLQYSSRNTIMIDDVGSNFMMNPRNGLKIRPFRKAHLNRNSDCELLALSQYLKMIVDEEDFSALDHKRWDKYKREREQTLLMEAGTSLKSNDGDV